jgi:hypothetical protein
MPGMKLASTFVIALSIVALPSVIALAQSRSQPRAQSGSNPGSRVETTGLDLNGPPIRFPPGKTPE